jgi:hypothetical protein
VFYLFVLGGTFVVAVVVTLLRADVPDARRWTLLLIGSVIGGPLATLLAGPLGAPEGVDLLIGLILTPLGFTAGALGTGLVMIRAGRHRDLGIALVIAGASVSLLAIYTGLAIVVSSITGDDMPNGGAVELIVHLGVATGIALGAAGAALAYVDRDARHAGSLRRLP